MVTEDSIITFHKLQRSNAPDEHNLYILTRIDTGVSKKLDKHIIALVENLSKGMTFLEAAYAIGYSVNVVLSVLEMLQVAHFFKHIENVAITGHSTIEFHKFRISSQPDDHNLIGIVRWDTDDTLRVDKDVVELIKSLSAGEHKRNSR